MHGDLWSGNAAALPDGTPVSQGTAVASIGVVEPSPTLAKTSSASTGAIQRRPVEEELQGVKKARMGHGVSLQVGTR